MQKSQTIIKAEIRGKIGFGKVSITIQHWCQKVHCNN